MSTHSLIGIDNVDGTATYVYCHFDGYLDCNGALLLGHYREREQVEALLALGELSSLGTGIEDTKAYHRDEGEEYKAPRIVGLEQFCQSAKYCATNDVYLFRDGAWLHAQAYGDGVFRPLTEDYIALDGALQ